jgi:hypothetical protein
MARAASWRTHSALKNHDDDRSTFGVRRAACGVPGERRTANRETGTTTDERRTTNV